MAAKKSEREVILAVGMSETGWKRMLDHGDVKMSVVEKIRKVLGMPPMNDWNVLFGCFAPEGAADDPHMVNGALGLYDNKRTEGKDYRQLYEECRDEREQLLRDAVAREKRINELMQEKEQAVRKPGGSSITSHER